MMVTIFLLAIWFDPSPSAPGVPPPAPSIVQWFPTYAACATVRDQRLTASGYRRSECLPFEVYPAMVHGPVK